MAVFNAGRPASKRAFRRSPVIRSGLNFRSSNPHVQDSARRAATAAVAVMTGFNRPVEKESPVSQCVEGGTRAALQGCGGLPRGADQAELLPEIVVYDLFPPPEIDGVHEVQDHACEGGALRAR